MSQTAAPARKAATILAFRSDLAVIAHAVSTAIRVRFMVVSLSDAGADRPREAIQGRMLLGAPGADMERAVCQDAVADPYPDLVGPTDVAPPSDPIGLVGLD